MSSPSTDPYFIVRDEVLKSLATANQQHSVWRRLVGQSRPTPGDSDRLNNTTAELRTSLRSIEWDLEDLQETLGIVERNPGKFRLSEEEMSNRRKFVDDSRRRLNEFKQQLANPSTAGGLTSPVPEGTPSVKMSGQSARYSSKGGDHHHSRPDDPEAAILTTREQQQLLVRSQDERLETIGDSISVLKGMSGEITRELDDQSALLDDFGQDMSRTESRMDANMKKLSRALNMTSDKRQWCAIGVLALIAFIIVVLLVVL